MFKIKILISRPIFFIVLIAFINSLICPYAAAGDLFLPAPGAIVHLSPPFDPPILKGIKVHPDNPFRFDFILDKGDTPTRGHVPEGYVSPSRLPTNEALNVKATQRNKTDDDQELRTEANKLIKYFLASLTIPEKDLWVNLSPYEKDRIIPNSFGLTGMGRDLLAEDYMLKQITASLIYPEDATGKKFWKRIYEEAAQKYGTTNIPVNTFNKVWIVPEKAVVYENAKAGTAYVVESRLKVMLEEDYLSMSKHADAGETRGQDPNINRLGSQIIREIVIPELTKEINEGKNFVQLRQVYNSLILATWYKKKIKDSLLAQVYEDKNKVAGVGGTNDVEAIYRRYLKAFKKGVYNYIKEEPDPMTQQIVPRKYFSGGVEFTWNASHAMVTVHNFDTAQLTDALQVTADFAMFSQPLVVMPSHRMIGVDSAMTGDNSIATDRAMSINSSGYSALMEDLSHDPDFVLGVIRDRETQEQYGLPANEVRKIAGRFKKDKKILRPNPSPGATAEISPLTTPQTERLTNEEGVRPAIEAGPGSLRGKVWPGASVLSEKLPIERPPTEKLPLGFYKLRRKIDEIGVFYTMTLQEIADSYGLSVDNVIEVFKKYHEGYKELKDELISGEDFQGTNSEQLAQGYELPLEIVKQLLKQYHEKKSQPADEVVPQQQPQPRRPKVAPRQQPQLQTIKIETSTPVSPYMVEGDYNDFVAWLGTQHGIANMTLREAQEKYPRVPITYMVRMADLQKAVFPEDLDQSNNGLTELPVISDDEKRLRQSRYAELRNWIQKMRGKKIYNLTIKEVATIFHLSPAVVRGLSNRLVTFMKSQDITWDNLINLPGNSAVFVTVEEFQSIKNEGNMDDLKGKGIEVLLKSEEQTPNQAMTGNPTRREALGWATGLFAGMAVSQGATARNDSFSIASDDAMNARKGGIDLTPAHMNVEVKMDSRLRGNDNGIRFHLDPAQLAQLQGARGFVPVIINIQPITDLKEFLLQQA